MAHTTARELAYRAQREDWLQATRPLVTYQGITQHYKLTARASLAAGLSSRALDRLADEARDLLVGKLKALDSEEAMERDDQGAFCKLGEGDESARKAALAHVNRRLKCDTGESCSHVCPLQEGAACDPDSPYREPDGSCNNLANPGWGKAYACEKRLLDAVYADGLSTLRVARSGGPLPVARRVSFTMHPEKNKPDKRLTHLTMAFGQFLTHDIAFAPPDPLPPLETFLGAYAIRKALKGSFERLNMEVPEDDPFYSKFGVTSLPFIRSLPCCQCELGPRQQMDSRTSFIDASQIYGIKKEITDALRLFSGGLLKEQTVGGYALLPQSLDPDNDRCSSPAEGKICFRSGDFRLNQNLGLVTLHTLFFREHNRIAGNLCAINPHWDDERAFQVTRRIVESRYQNVVFNEWLPEIIGPEVTKRYGLRPRSSGYTKYDPQVDPTMVNEFAAAALRFGHSDINGNFKLLGRNGKQVGEILLKDNYFQQFDFYEGTTEDTALRGFIHEPMQTTDRYGDTGVTNYMFRPLTQEWGNDLFATDLQRGRDHGIPPYSDYVRLCRNVTIDSFEDLYKKKLMPRAIAQLYSTIYGSVHDIDLFSAGLNEAAVEGAAMGPTFLCIFAEMFKKLKYGDRFYFEHGYQAGSFTPEQLKTLRETTLAKIICENTGIKTKLQKNVFRLPSRERKVDCKDLPDIRLDLWTDKSQCNGNGGCKEHK
ncbi:salivary peroxidase/catechol oxidase-like [Haemaphysalis longicornis]